jgi:hypothetical protein
MSLYLLNADYPLTSLVLRSSDGRPTKGKADVIGELRDLVPLPWLACFKASDLVPCSVEMTAEDGTKSVHELLQPCTPTENALINLDRAKPFFERLTGERILAGAYWQRAVTEIKRYTRHYLALDYADLLGFSKLEALNAASREGLTWTDAGFEALKAMFFTWTDGVRPLEPPQLDTAPPSGDRFLNGMTLDVNTVAPDSVWGVGS